MLDLIVIGDTSVADIFHSFDSVLISQISLCIFILFYFPKDMYKKYVDPLFIVISCSVLDSITVAE